MVFSVAQRVGVSLARMWLVMAPFVRVRTRICVRTRTCVHVGEREESLERVMLTVGWPWCSQSSSCRWERWLSVSLPTHDGSFIIIRHIVKRCRSGRPDWVCVGMYWRCADFLIYKCWPANFIVFRFQVFFLNCKSNYYLFITNF